MKKFLITLVLTLLFCSINLIKAEAINEEFLIDLDITYQYNNQGYVEVVKKYSIINQRADLTITNFQQTLESYSYFDLEAFDNLGKVEVKEEEQNDRKRISIPIRNSRIGKGQVNSATFNYKSRALVSKNGNITSFNLPKISEANIRNAVVKLIVPDNVGKEVFISPDPSKVQLDEKTNLVTYTFSGNSATKFAISATFGEYQAINFDIKYQLENNSKWFQVQEIALIPDIINRQEVMIDSLEPKPFEIYIDEDGNYLGKYRISPSEKVDISYRGTMRTYIREIDLNGEGKYNEIPQELIEKYTKGNEFWEITHPVVKEISSSLYDENLGVSSNVSKIYNFIVENYEYDFEIIKNATTQRNGAVKALEREVPMGCMEFTDAFIALVRSIGIPAREINGYAFSNDPSTNPINIDLNGGDRLHAWAEYYDPAFGWVPVDPTWGSTSKIDYFTKLDLNHLALVTKGVDPNYPIPAGFYKRDNSSKSLQFDFPDNPTEIYFDKSYIAEKVFSFNTINLLTGYEPVRVINTGKTSLFNIEGKNLPPFQETTIYVPKGGTLSFQDFVGNSYLLRVTNSLGFYLMVIAYTVFLGLLLYVMTIVLVTHSKSLRKFFHRLYSRPRVRGR